MNRKFIFVLVAGLIGALSLFTLGCEMCCNSSQGSGSIVITDPVSSASHKATFSYRVECIGSYSDAPDAVRTVTGRLEYQDHIPWKKNGGAKTDSVSIHGYVDSVALVDDGVCSQNQNHAVFKGQYRPQPTNLGEGGTFTIEVTDNGKPGPSSEDTFAIKLDGGVFSGYSVNGVLAGGNIKSL